MYSLVSLILLQLCLRLTAQYSCLDESGLPIDYWTTLKAYDSSAYYYQTIEMSQFQLSEYNVDQAIDGAIMATVNQVYQFDDGENVALIMWNDEPPPDNTASDTYAHSKGVLFIDETQGFYLIHSKPNWPATRNSTNNQATPFPDDQYAQSLMCITVSSDTANIIAGSLQVNRPYIYSSYISSSMASEFPMINSVINKVTTSTDYSIVNISSIGNLSFTQFAKSKNWGKDLYDDLVAPYYEVPLNVETWIDGSGGRMSSLCTNQTDVVEYDIYQVNSITMRSADGAHWSNTEDHSKWCTSTGSSDTLVSCVGDINRMCSQESRGGGTLCFSNSNLHASFKDIIDSVETCNLYDPCTGSSQCYYCSM